MISKQERDEEIITNSCFEPSMSLEKKKVVRQEEQETKEKRVYLEGR